MTFGQMPRVVLEFVVVELAPEVGHRGRHVLIIRLVPPVLGREGGRPTLDRLLLAGLRDVVA
ncbi:MAG: hypothetical protein K8E66_07140, partial [Phycisphaerales bacterium]|nr:hypothetical protein [Phycisphaerales bacterium]